MLGCTCDWMDNIFLSQVLCLFAVLCRCIEISVQRLLLRADHDKLVELDEIFAVQAYHFSARVIQCCWESSWLSGKTVKLTGFIYHTTATYRLFWVLQYFAQLKANLLKHRHFIEYIVISFVWGVLLRTGRHCPAARCWSPAYSLRNTTLYYLKRSSFYQGWVCDVVSSVPVSLTKMTKRAENSDNEIRLLLLDLKCAVKVSPAHFECTCPLLSYFVSPTFPQIKKIIIKNFSY